MSYVRSRGINNKLPRPSTRKYTWVIWIPKLLFLYQTPSSMCWHHVMNLPLTIRQISVSDQMGSQDQLLWIPLGTFHYINFRAIPSTPCLTSLASSDHLQLPESRLSFSTSPCCSHWVTELLKSPKRSLCFFHDHPSPCRLCSKAYLHME